MVGEAVVARDGEFLVGRWMSEVLGKIFRNTNYARFMKIHKEMQFVPFVQEAVSVEVNTLNVSLYSRVSKRC